MADPRVHNQDAENYNSILKHIADIDLLRGICILLKPFTNKVGVMFQCGIKEPSVNLQRDACKNIIFCFTHSRGTSFLPDDTLPTFKGVDK